MSLTALLSSYGCRFVLQKSPLLLEEMFRIAMLPRPPTGYGWLVGTFCRHLRVHEMQTPMGGGVG